MFSAICCALNEKIIVSSLVVVLVAMAENGITVREIGLRRDDSYFLRQFVVEAPDGQFVQVAHLRLLTEQLREHLQLRLSFFAKVKFDMQHFVLEDVWGDGPVPVNSHYMLKPSAWRVEAGPRPDARMDGIVQVAQDKLATHLEQARLRGSREQIGGVKRIYLLVGPGEAMGALPSPGVGDDRDVGKHPHPLPPELARKKCLWNPETHDWACFQWCVRAHLLGVATMSAEDRKVLTTLTDERLYKPEYAPVRVRKRDLRQHLQGRTPEDFGYDFSSLPDPASSGVRWEDIATFEQVNRGHIGVYVWEWVKTEWGPRKYFERVLVREPSLPQRAPCEVHLLRVSDHYMLIHNLRAFHSSQGAAMDGSRSCSHVTLHICPNCRCNFKDEKALQRHRRSPCHRDPGRRVAELTFPTPEKGNHLVKYVPKSSEEMACLVLYSDLEVFSDLPPSSGVAQHTYRLQRRVASAAFLAVGRNGFYLSEDEKVYLLRAQPGEHEFGVVERYLRRMLYLGKKYLTWKRSVNIPVLLTAEQRTRHEAATHCECCGRGFDTNNPRAVKVCHHRHGTGEFLGSFCSSCNGHIVQPRCVPVVLHNGGNYDFKFLLRAIAYLQGRPDDDSDSSDDDKPGEGKVNDEDVGCGELPEADFDLDENVDFKKLKLSVLFKSNEKVLQFTFGNLVFIDSFNFYHASLSKLMDELAKTAEDGDLSSVFRHVAATHPELQPEAMTAERRERLRQKFAPGSHDIEEEQYKKWVWHLLLRKLPMPFDYMTGPEVWNESAVWDVKKYASKLKSQSEEELVKEHALLRETCYILGLQSFAQVHDTYLYMDLSLSDIMEAFRAAFHKKFGLDPLQYTTLPSAAYAAMKKHCLNRKAARLVTDPVIYQTLRSTLMGGLSCAFQGHAVANAPELGEKHWDPSQPKQWLLAMDISSMYPFMMTKPLPISSGQVVQLPEGWLARIEWVQQALKDVDFRAKDECHTYLIVLDYSIPLHLHDSIDWAPPCRMRVGINMISEHTRNVMRENGLGPSSTEKLVPFLGAHQREGMDIKRLKFMTEVLGCRIDKIHQVILFKTEPFLADWMRSTYNDRLAMKREKRAVEAETLKLVLNGVYGMFMQNVQGFSNTNLYVEPSKFVKAINGARMCDFDVLEGDSDCFLGLVSNARKQTLQTSLVQVGWRVLELSKLEMLVNHYCGVKVLFPRAIVTMTDTDSAHYLIESEEDPVITLAKANVELADKMPCFFDVAKDLVGKPKGLEILNFLTPAQRELAWSRAGELGGFGVEYLPKRIVEEVNLRSKLYTIAFTDGGSEQKCKGVMKRVCPGHQDYLRTMESGRESSVTFSMLSSKRFTLGVVQMTKKALSPFNDKVFQLNAQRSRPLGHWRNDPLLVALDKALGIDSKPFQQVMLFLVGRADAVRSR